MPTLDVLEKLSHRLQHVACGEEIGILTVHSPDVGPVMKTKMKDKA